MKVISLNTNGIRASLKRGFSKWARRSNADIICLQEVKAQTEHLPHIPNYHLYLNSATKKGYSGVAVYTKQKPVKVSYTLGFKRFDQEGRMLTLKYKNFTIINVYLPHGGRQKKNIIYKLKAYKYLFAYLRTSKNTKVILMGDFNVAHKEIDLARPQNNRNNIMFTPAERKRVDMLLNLGFTDTFRKLHKDSGHYTWWPYAFEARERNIGWRIDYGFISNNIETKLRRAFILDKTTLSDHCPIGLEIAA